MNQQTVSVTIDHEDIARAIVRGRRMRSEMAWFLIGRVRSALQQMVSTQRAGSRAHHDLLVSSD